MAYQPPNKIKINWMEDAYGKVSCHLNDGGLMAKDSYVGHVFFRNGKWCSVLKDCDIIEEHRTQDAAKQRVQDSVNGEPVSVW